MKKSPACIIVLSMIFIFNGLLLHAQSYLKGTIIDSEEQAIPFANILLLSPADSTLIKGEVTDENGFFNLEVSAPDSYIIAASMIGYKMEYSEILSITENNNQSIDIGPLQLSEDIEALETVEVIAKKPLFEQKVDRLVVNVQNSLTSAGATALEVLERSPGVIVNRQNSALSLIGKQGVVVMINGKINRTPTEAVVQMLQGMSADNIEKIELITTPPANYDAEGDAGFINIVLKKTTDAGLNGTISLSGGIGEGSTSAASGNFNYRKEKINLFGDYSFSRESQKQLFENFRSVLIDTEQFESSTISNRDPIQLNHNGRLGLDYQISEKSVFGVLVSAYDNKWTMDAINKVEVQIDGMVDTLITLDNVETNQWKHIGGNVNFQHDFDKDTRLNFDADYLYYTNENPTDYSNTYTDAGGNLFFTEETRSRKSTPIRIAVGKIDFSKNLSEKLKMEAGLKGTLSRFKNDISVAELVSEIWVLNPNFTAQYDLEEDIAAAYTAFDIQLTEKTSIKAGLRYEYTRSNLGTVEQANIVDRKFGELFPTLFIAQQLSEDANVNLSYSRRITRPTFNDMAPFVIFIDPNTFFSGNTALQPAISNTIKTDVRYKTFMFSLALSQDDDAIARFQPRLDENTNQTVIGAENLDYRRTASAFMSFPVEITEWWQMRVNVGGLWQKIKANFDGEPVSITQKNWNMNGSQNFQLPAGFSAEIMGFYSSRQLAGTSVAQPIWGMNFGIQKQLKGENGRIRFGIDDIFESIRWRATTDIPEQNLIYTGMYDFSVRTYKISYSRNFGNKKLKTARSRATGAEDERRRVN